MEAGRGRFLVDQEGHYYLINRFSDKTNQGFWRCYLNRRKKEKCKATLCAQSNRIVYKKGIHTHPPPTLGRSNRGTLKIEDPLDPLV